MPTACSREQAENGRNTVQKDFRDSYVNIFCNNSEDLRIIEHHLMDFWKIPYRTNLSRNEDCLAALVYSQEVSGTITNTSTLIIPSESPEFQDWLRKKEIHAEHEYEVSLRFPISTKVSMVLSPRRMYRYQSPLLASVLTFNGYPVIQRISGQETYLFTINIVEEFQGLLDRSLTPEIARYMKIYGKMALPYNIIPNQIRRYLLEWSSRNARIPSNYEDKCPLEALRYLLLIGLLTVSKRQIPTIDFWRRGKKYACCLTHDIESLDGLSKAPRLKLIERMYGAKSCWYVPTSRYKIPSNIHEVLNGEIGAHDTKHDGKLLFLSKRELSNRTAECKSVLGKITRENVQGFRAPLLQYSKQILNSAGEAGFQYDTSCPTWEPYCLHRSTLKQQGIGTVFPLMFNSIVEIPVTLPQDICLLCILRNNLRKSASKLIEITRWIKTIGGLCTLLVHPDYEFASPNAMAYYEQLIENLAKDPECWIVLPGELAEWWKMRHEATIKIDRDIPMIHNVHEKWQNDFEIRLFTSYGPQGFISKPLDGMHQIEINKRQ